MEILQNPYKTKRLVLLLAAAIILFSTLLFMTPVMADSSDSVNTGSSSVTMSGDYSTDNLITLTSSSGTEAVMDAAELALGFVIALCRYFGAAILVWGFVQFALSLITPRPEDNTRSLMIIFTGAVLVSLESILQNAGIIT